MIAEFSEFSFEFAFIHEYVNHNAGLTAAPELPSLRKEAVVGWDAKLTVQGHPKFFQFKLSEYLFRSKASQWPAITGRISVFASLHKINLTNTINSYGLLIQGTMSFTRLPCSTKDENSTRIFGQVE